MILITGGAGYIGSHTCIELAEAGYDLVVLDNLSNSSVEALKRVEKLTRKKIVFVHGDIRNSHDLQAIFTKYTINAVVHFAGLKVLSESVIEPFKYYDNNVSGTITLCNVMAEFDCKTLVFSSSATVYAESSSTPIHEETPLSPNSPYGRSKLIVEELLKDLYTSDPAWSIAVLRYFNPVGAHESGLIGENPNGIPTNLMPCISQVAVGKRRKLRIYGHDYPTSDGTGVRDYIHVMDLASAHTSALENISGDPHFLTLNLGTGRGYSVLEVLNAFESTTGRPIPYEIVPRRPMDLAQCLADPTLAYKTLGWQAKFDIHKMCADSWHWQSMNPNGYC